MLRPAASEGRKQRALMNGGRVHIEVRRGQGLVIRDKNLFSKGGSSGPYVKVTCGGKREVGGTGVMKKSLNPQGDVYL